MQPSKKTPRQARKKTHSWKQTANVQKLKSYKENVEMWWELMMMRHAKKKRNKKMENKIKWDCQLVQWEEDERMLLVLVT